MSQVALCRAVRDTIQALLGLDANSVEIGVDGAPKPTAGQVFVSVHPGSWDVQGEDFSLLETMGVNVTVTMRLGTAPQDRWGIGVWAASGTGLEATLRRIITAIHYSHAVRTLANTFITEGDDKFHRPLELTSVSSPPDLKGPEWFSAAPPETEYQVAECGVAQTLYFGKAIRCQRADLQG